MLSIKEYQVWPDPKSFNLDSMQHKKYLTLYTQILFQKRSHSDDEAWKIAKENNVGSHVRGESKIKF